MNHLSKRVTITVIAGCLTAGSLASGLPASAAQPGVTRPILRVIGYGVTQQGQANGVATAVGAPKSNHCFTTTASADNHYPGPFLVEPGAEELRINLQTSVKPVRHNVAVYAKSLRTDPKQRAVHPGSRLVRTTLPNGHHTWQFRSTLHLAVGQSAYLNLHVAWPDTQCGGRDEYGYTFLVQAAS